MTTLTQGLENFAADQRRRIVVGLDRGAGVLEAEAQGTTAYNDRSTATRSSTIAFVVAEGTGSANPAAAAAIAQTKLDAYRASVDPSYSGSALLEPAGAFEEGHMGIVLTVPTDYVFALEAGNHGFLEDAIRDVGDTLTAIVAHACRS